MKISRKITAAALAATTFLGLGTAAAPAASAYPSTADSVTQAWYRDFLGRSYESARVDTGRQYWVAQMTSGGLRGSDALWAITHSREYVEREIAGYYGEHLGRTPDRGAAYWVEGAVAGRFPLEWVEQNILGSREYANRASYDGWARYALVDEWYYDVLGRSGGANTGEEAYWLRRVDRVGLLTALRELWYSEEAVRGRIAEHYQLVGRYEFSNPPTYGEVSYWYGKEVESDINVQVLIASSPEYVAAH